MSTRGSAGLLFVNGFYNFAYYFFVCFITFYPKYELQSASVAGTLLAMLFIGNLVVEPITAVYVDSGRERPLMYGLLMLSLGMGVWIQMQLSSGEPLSFALLLATCFIFGATSATIRPMIYAAVKGFENTASLNAYLMTFERVAMILGVGLGLHIYRGVGNGSLMLLVNVLGLLSLASVAVFYSRKPIAAEPKKSNFWAEFREGFAYVWKSPEIRAIFLFLMLLNILYPPTISLMLPYLIEDTFRLGFEWVSAVVIIQGVSVVLGMLTMKKVIQNQAHRRSLFTIGLVLIGAGLLLFCIPSPISLIIGAILTGFGLSFTRLTSLTQLQYLVPGNMVGRTVGQLTVFASALVPASSAIFGLLIDKVHGDVLPLMIVVGAVLGGSAVFVYRWKSLRQFFNASLIPVFLIAVFVGTGLRSAPAPFTYTRPIPEAPQFIDPSTINDIVNCSLAAQVHGTLFRESPNGRPYPYLVKQFDVANNGLTYLFTLREMTFSNGHKLTSRLVKLSLENAVRNNAVNHHELGTLKGIDKFFEKKAKEIVGIHIIDDQRFAFHLRFPNKDILSVLSDIRFAIWDITAKDTQHGLGLYDLVNRSPGEVRLKLNAERTAFMERKLPTEFQFKVLKDTEAVTAFRARNVDDLFLYSLDPKETESMGEFAHRQSIPTARTYGMFLNARNISDLKTRETLFAKLNPKKLHEACYPGTAYSTSLVPQGYLGHTPVNKEFQAGTKSHSKKLSVAVLDIIYQKECVRDYLQNALGMPVEIISLETFLPRWFSSKLDLWVGYIDAENSDTFFGDFSPQSRLQLGDPSDKNFAALYRKYILEEKKPDKVEMARVLADHILSRQTVAPLFHPEATMVYQKRIKKFDAPLKSPCFVPTEYLELESET